MDTLDRFTSLALGKMFMDSFVKKSSFNELSLTLFPRFCCWSHTGKWHHHFSIPHRHLFSQKGIDRKFYLVDNCERKKRQHKIATSLWVLWDSLICVPSWNCFSQDVTVLLFWEMRQHAWNLSIFSPICGFIILE